MLNDFPDFDFEMEPEVDPDLETILEEIFGQDNVEQQETQEQQQVLHEEQDQVLHEEQDQVLHEEQDQVLHEEQEETQEDQVLQEQSQHSSPEVHMNLRIDNIGMQPKYIMTNVFRGDSIDTFYEKPLNKNMVSNDHVINMINEGTDVEIISLPNFICATPGTKAKCDTSMECKFFTDVTLCLTIKYNLTNVADVYKRVAMLSDRVCLGCKSTSAKVVCLSGKWRCHNCIKRGRNTDFMTGLEEWLKNGCPSRHTQGVRSST